MININKLEGGLFLDHPIAIRFYLGEGLPFKKRVEQANFRALEIFEKTFSKSQKLLVVIKVYENSPMRIEKEMKFLRTCFNNDSLLDKSYDYDTGYFFVKTTKKKVDYKLLIRASINTDLGAGYEPKLDWRIFFLTKEKNVVFHVYDDRGCDVVAEKEEDIRPLYRTYHDWLSTYKRDTEKMGKFF